MIRLCFNALGCNNEVNNILKVMGYNMLFAYIQNNMKALDEKHIFILSTFRFYGHLGILLTSFTIIIADQYVPNVQKRKFKF